MNLRLAERWEKAERATLVSLAFLLPVVFYLKTYDASTAQVTADIAP